jgi:hypothetical protein
MNGETILTVSPTSQTEVGTHAVIFSVTDGFDPTTMTLMITITNSPPYFGSAFPSTYTAYLN